MNSHVAARDARASAASGLARATVAVFIITGVLALTSGGALAHGGARTVGERGGVLLAPPFADPNPAAGDSLALLAVCPVNVRALDVPDDAGGAIRVTWDIDDAVAAEVTRFQILRFAAGEEPDTVGLAAAGDRQFVDDTAVGGTAYQYVVRAVSGGGPADAPGGSADSIASDAAAATAQWFAQSRLNVLVVTLFACGAIAFYIARARKGTDLYIRKIPGLEAVDDAVGRATEMGRPVLYVPGIETVSEVGTLAALTILGHVAKKVAQHGTPLLVPTADPIVMTTAQEIVKAAYAEVGQSDRYDPLSVNYLTYDQFGYTAGVDGIMVRERPEAVFLLGYFAAESLILAETGHAIGAIQISGTKETSQLPFFVAACDYTLIGEELFAASSYLSHEPVMLGSLKGQDFAKLWIVILIVLMFAAGTIGYALTPDGSSPLARAFDAVKAWFAGA